MIFHMKCLVFIQLIFSLLILRPSEDKRVSKKREVEDRVSIFPDHSSYMWPTATVLLCYPGRQQVDRAVRGLETDVPSDTRLVETDPRWSREGGSRLPHAP